MGLAGAKNRRKLAKDPNNTRWSRNTDSFGHRMLRSQGWEPGQYLGPKGAAHAEFHTAANASHIRVVLKEDNLGLGAKLKRGDECTGLSAFKDMLARLNGQSEVAIETEKRAREDYQRSLYVERKFGNMRFVSGGFLVGDKIQEESTSTPSDSGAQESDGSPDAQDNEVATEEKPRKEKKSKKRKVEDDDGTDDKEARRREKKRKRRRAEDTTGDGMDEEGAEPDVSVKESEQEPKRSKDKKKSKKEKKGGKDEVESKKSKDSEDDARREKKEKKKRKKEKRKEAADSEADASTEAAVDSGGDAPTQSRESTAPGSGASTPAASGTSTPVSIVSARHLARRRFIAQKRMAMGDQQALNQIFMIKS